MPSLNSLFTYLLYCYCIPFLLSNLLIFLTCFHFYCFLDFYAFHFIIYKKILILFKISQFHLVLFILFIFRWFIFPVYLLYFLSPCIYPFYLVFPQFSYNCSISNANEVDSGLGKAQFSRCRCKTHSNRGDYS